MNAKQKVIIDCDPGIDDALALMLALSSPELDVLGITVVCGNVPAKTGVENALRILKWMGRLDIPVYSGETKPLERPYEDATETHGGTGLGNLRYPTVTEVRPREGAVEFLASSLSEAARTGDLISVIAIGPMTNLARLAELHPECFAGLDRLVSMGGNYHSHGNCSPVAEYNYWCDPHAARAVFEAFETLPALAEKEIQMIGLDVTRQIVLTPNLRDYLCRLNPWIGALVRDMTDFYMDFHWQQEGLIGCVINDPLAVAYFLEPDLCRGFSAYTTVETEGLCIGQSVVDAEHFWKKAPNCHILTEADPLGFMVLFFSRLLKKDPLELRPMLARLMGGIVK